MDHRTTKDKINADFNAAHYVHKSWMMPYFHFHDAYEIYLSMSDGIQYFIEDGVYPANKGDLFVFNSRDIHKTVVPPDVVYDRYILTFMPEYVETMSTERTDLLECFLDRPPDFSYRLHLAGEQLCDFLGLFEKAIHYCCQDGLYGSDIYKKLILTEILIKINEFYRRSETGDDIKPDRDYKRVKEVIHYIHKNLGSDLSLEVLAGKFFLSKYHLGYLFKKVTGFTVNEYIISRRIMKARELLKNNLPVSQVGEMAGFNNISHFIRTFKKLIGMSPKQYAKTIWKS